MLLSAVFAQSRKGYARGLYTCSSVKMENSAPANKSEYRSTYRKTIKRELSSVTVTHPEPKSIEKQTSRITTGSFILQHSASFGYGGKYGSRRTSNASIPSSFCNEETARKHSINLIVQHNLVK